jgi:hypothetical protein
VVEPAVARTTVPTSNLLAGCPQVTTMPRAIRIPAIAVSSRDVAPLGLNADRTLAVPPLSKVGQLGWYKCSPVPGDTGPAVVMAHIDQKGKPGLFAKLDQLTPGDTVEIDRSDGQTAIFRVVHSEQFPKAEFPASIYSTTPDAQLRLITCGGRFDPARKSYLDQTVVYARLVGLRPLSTSRRATAASQLRDGNGVPPSGPGASTLDSLPAHPGF